MRSILIKLLVFLILLFGFGFLLQSISDRGLRIANYNHWDDIYNSRINAGILIQGNSRAQYNISPLLIDSALGKNSYNLAVSGFNFLTQYYRFLVYLKHNKAPQYIIQNVDDFTISKQIHLLNYTQFFPYFKDILIKKELAAFSVFDWRDYYVPYYKYIGNYKAACQGIMANIKPPSAEEKKNKGFIPLNGHFGSPFKDAKLLYEGRTHYEIDTSALQLFKNFLDSCKSKRISVIFVFAPVYYTEPRILINGDSNVYRNFSTQYHIPFLDYSHDSICLDSLNFMDPHHLNGVGLTKFNRKLAADLKTLIK